MKCKYLKTPIKENKLKRNINVTPARGDEDSTALPHDRRIPSDINALITCTHHYLFPASSYLKAYPSQLISLHMFWIFINNPKSIKCCPYTHGCEPIYEDHKKTYKQSCSTRTVTIFFSTAISGQ